MAVLVREENKKNFYTEVDVVNVLFNKIDEALDNIENGRPLKRGDTLCE